MSDSHVIQPDKRLMARLHAACMPGASAAERSAISLGAGKLGDMDHVIESPDNVVREEQPPRKGDYRPQEA